MARVFLSHSSRDNAAAAELKAWLDGQGFASGFLDFDKHIGIPAGADWERTLYEQIQRCQALVILQTPNWSASRWCFAEFTQARALGKPIFQVVESDEAAAEKPIAADLQRLDLRHDRPAGLEQLRRELERIALQDQGGFPWPPPTEPSRPPFPGLMVFEAEDAPVFFGRDNDWRTVIERLRTHRVQGGPRLLVIQGSSGSGKSSLLRAGVLPRLRRAGREWLVLPVLRPQARPLESLAQALAVALQRPEAWRELHQQLLVTTEAPALADLVAGWAADLRLAAATPEAQLLLPIDQAEELFTMANQVEQQRFVTVLAAALQPRLPLQAVMTIRADAIGSLQSLPELVNIFDTLPLGPLSLERYREIIEGPARVAGLKVEPAFVERAIHDTGTEDALPLLAFALRQLHDQYGGDGLLSLSDYLALGDPAACLSPLENAVKQAADGVLQAQRPDQASLQALREAFVPAMVRVSEQGNYARRAAVWDTLPQAAWPLLEALVAARLLVRRQGEGKPNTVEVAHEALLRVWPLLSRWLDESRDFLLGSQQLEEDLSQWQAATQADKPRALLSGLKLAKGRAWLAERGEQLRPELRSFILASQRRATRQRRLLIGSATAAFAVITGAGGFAYLKLRQSQAAQAAQFEATHRALLSSDPFMSVVYGLAAAKTLIDQRHPWEAAQLSQSLAQAADNNIARTAPIPTAQGEIHDIAELNNGELISVGEQINGGGVTLRRWLNGKPISTGKPIALGYDLYALIALMHGGLLIGDSVGTLQLWQDGEPVGEPIKTGQGGMTCLLELRNGELISAGEDQTLRRWRDGKPIGNIINTGQDGISSMVELANGELISGGRDGSLRRWRDGKPVGKPIKTGQGAISVLVNLRNGETISAGPTEGTLRRWRNGNPVGNFISKTQDGISSVVELRNGEVIVASINGSLQRWRDGKLVGQSFNTAQRGIVKLLVLKSGDLISAGRDGTLLKLRIGKPVGNDLLIPTGQGAVTSLAPSKNGDLISGSENGTLRRWQAGRALGRPITTGQGAIWSLLELRNGELISAGQDGTLRRWRFGKPVGSPISTGQGWITSIVELKNGELISGGNDGTLRRWRDGRPVGDGKAIPTNQGIVMSLIELTNRIVVSGGQNGTFRLWRDGKPVGDGQAIQTGQGEVLGLLELNNGELISGGENGTLRRWRDGRFVEDGLPITTGQGRWIRGLIQIKQNELVSAGEDGTLRRWRDGKPVGDGLPLTTGQGRVWSLASGKNAEIVSGNSNGTLRWWSLATIARNTCSQIDLDSIPTSTEGLANVVKTAKATCNFLGVHTY